MSPSLPDWESAGEMCGHTCVRIYIRVQEQPKSDTNEIVSEEKTSLERKKNIMTCLSAQNKPANKEKGIGTVHQSLFQILSPVLRIYRDFIVSVCNRILSVRFAQPNPSLQCKLLHLS